MLDMYPGTLVTIEWHSPGYTPAGSDFSLPEYSQRAALYSVGGILIVSGTVLNQPQADIPMVTGVL